MKKSVPIGQGPIPMHGRAEESDVDSAIADLAVPVLRDSQERREILRTTGVSHEEIEERLATGEARRLVLVAAVAHIFEQLPKIVQKAVGDAIEGNLAASKLILEIAGLRDAAQIDAEPVEESETGLGPLEAGMLESLRQQVAAMPGRPEPPARK